MIVYNSDTERKRSNFVFNFLYRKYQEDKRNFSQPISTFELCSKLVSENIKELYTRLKEYEKETP